MPVVPDPEKTTANAIYAWHAERKDEFREHLGASLIGHHCDRYLWLTFRWAFKPEFPGRLLRLFETGKREEERIINELRAIGVDLHTEEDGNQIQCRDAFGHFGGSVDGVGRGFPEAPKTWAVFEAKTMNDKAFTGLIAKGLKAEKPQHYAQVQTYMGLLNLERAMYVAVNKNSDTIHSEWVHFDASAFNRSIDRAGRVVTSTLPLTKASEDPSNWLCKMCDGYDLCHKDKVAEVNCRTCCHSTAQEGGTWHCGLHSKLLTYQDQLNGCDGHLMIPPLVPNAEAVDGGVNHIEYKDKTTGETFTQGIGYVPSLALATRQSQAAGRRKVPGIPFDDEIPF